MCETRVEQSEEVGAAHVDVHLHGVVEADAGDRVERDVCVSSSCLLGCAVVVVVVVLRVKVLE